MTVTINAVSGSGVVTTSDGSGIVKLQSNSVTTNALAWVSFNGTAATVTFSYNVSSITRNSTGNYTVNYSNALTNSVNSFGTNSVNGFGSMYLSSQSASSATFVNTNNAGLSVDGSPLSVIVFGN